MSITLYSNTKHTGTAVSFTPNGDVYNDTKFLKFPLKSIKNNTDYCIVVRGAPFTTVFFGSIDDTKSTDADGTTSMIRAIKMPINSYKITMIVFVVLFCVLFIGLLVLYFTGMLTFQSYSRGTTLDSF